jgi:outer membrane autotransporter protein
VFHAVSPCFGLLRWLFLMIAVAGGVPAWLARGQTQIPSGATGYLLNAANGTNYVVGAGVQINNPSTTAPSAAIYDTSGNSVSWAIRNFGVVGWVSSTSTGSPYNGIYLYSSGTSTIINEASGSIISGQVTGAARAGVNFSNGYGILINAGYVYGAAHGVIIGYGASSPGGSVTNSGTIIGNASSRYGISAVYGAVVVRNTGGLISSTASDGVSFASTVASGSLWNSGGGTIIGGAYGVNTNNGGFIENNAALIQGNGLAGIRFAGGPGTIRNIFGGTILGTAGHGINTGAVTVMVENDAAHIEGAAGSGVRLAGASSILRNFGGGVIMGSAHGITVEGAAGVLVENSAAGIKGGNHGVSFNASASGTARNINSGSITGANSGVYALGAVVVENEAGSLIEAESAAANHAGVYLGAGGTVVNRGTIRSVNNNIAVLFFATDAAEGSLTLDTGSVLDGDVISAKATGNKIVLAGEGVEDSHFTGTSADTGFESLTMNGTQWTLGGSIALTGTAADALAVNSGTLTLGGALAMPNAGGVSLAADSLLHLDFAGDASLAGVISGAGSLTHAGPGLLELTGSNTYSGRTTITSGTIKGGIGSSALHLGSASATYLVDPSATRVTLANITGNGVVDIQSADLVFDVVDPTDTQTYDFAGTLNSNGGNKLVKSGEGKLTLTQSLASKLDGGTVVENGTLGLADASYIVATGLVLGGGTTAGLIEYTGAGNWSTNVTLAGAGGGFSVASGTQGLAITVDGSGAFVKGGDGTLDIRSILFGAGIDATEVRGGALIGNKDVFRGDITLSDNGTVVYEHNGTAWQDTRDISGAGNFIKTGDGLLELTGSNTYAGDTTVCSGTLQGNIGTGALAVDSGATYKVASGIDAFSIAGVQGGGTIDLNAASLNLDVGAGVSSTFSFSGSLISANPASALVKTGAGTVELQSVVALQGGAAIQDGTLRLANQNFIQAPVVLGTGSTSGLIEYTGSAAWAHDITLAAGGGGGFAVNGGTLALTGGFAINGAGDFVKGGNGTLDITAANITDTANGVVRVLDGTLRGNAATFKAGGIEAVAAASVIEFYQTTSGSYGGVISGSGALVKTGDGALALGGANTYGDTIIRGGMLSGNLGGGSLTVEASGTFKVDDSATEFSVSGVLGNGTIDMANANMVLNVASGTTEFAFAGSLTGGKQFIKTGAGTLDLRSGVPLNDGAAIREGVLRLADQSLVKAPVVIGTATTAAMIEYTGASAWAHAVTLQGLGGGFIVGSGEVAISAAINSSDHAVFVKDGAGALDITGATTGGLGGAKILAGVLRGNAASMPGAAVEISAGASAEFYQVADAAYAGAISGSGSLIKTGTGALTLSGSLTHTGATLINQGLLKLAAAGVLPSGTPLSIGANGAFDTGGFNHSIATLANDGVVYLNASVNSRVGVIETADKMTVTGTASGTGQVLVRLSESETTSGAATATVMEITGTDASGYTAGLAGRAVTGPYDWTVAKEGNQIVLAVGELSPEVAAAGGLDASTYLVGKTALASLSQRLMISRSGGQDHSFQLWGGGLRREDTLTSDLYDGAEARTNGIQLGGDWNIGKAVERPVTLGVFYDHASSELDMPAGASKSTTKSYGLGIYGSYRTKSLYVDVILRNARDEFEVRVPYTGSFSTQGYSMAASVEVGGVLANKSPWNVEPQLQLVYQRHTIDNIVDGMGRDITIDSADSVEGRAGVRLWREFADADRTLAFIPYLRGSIMYEANGKGTVTFLQAITDPENPGRKKDVVFDNKFGGSAGVVDGGFALEWKRGFRLQANGAWYYGDRMEGFSASVAAAFVW